DFRHVQVFLDVVIDDAHGIEDRLDDTHTVALGLPRWHTGFFLQETDHHADRQIVFDRVAANGVDGIEQSRLLDQKEPALAGERQAGADADAFVLLTNADEPGIGQLSKRPEQAFAGGDIGHRYDELNPARPDFPDDALAGQTRHGAGRRFAH